MAILDGPDLKKWEEVAVSAAKQAGEVIEAAFYKPKNVEHKGKVDLVTETDKACEDLIYGIINKAFPTHEFIGEEGSSIAGTAELTDAPTWMVDPLDGTTNFVHRFPFVCVSIGLSVKKEVVVGVVYNPILHELFTAVRGQGAFLNGQPISASAQVDLGNALIATECGTKRDKATVDRTTDLVNDLLYKVRSVRMSGSCALNLASIACGRIDAFYEIGFGGPWDVAGGALLVEEAGGRVADVSGGPFKLMSQRVLATNSHLTDAFVNALGVDDAGERKKENGEDAAARKRRLPQLEK
eukprot:TRINITY_DN22202_c0_g1_i1.p1 TRINITY_DN22202_c0_g1~~TRINITY_DN22202_c0_g1_i1.p1  ORF type:complete len:297 (-),score=56.91 TRINITY_DN22202_c0_g1_i1:204-1094(-)